jgi:glycosyltransferase involved in cell wall biosynthesis
MRILVAHDVPGTREGGMTRIMRFIHSRLGSRGYQVNYLHAEDVVARATLRRFVFPLAVFQHVRAEALAGRPYDIVNIHEPSALMVLLGRKDAGNPRVVVTSHGVEQRSWELALEEARLGREGPSRKSRVVYPATSLWQSRYNLRHADHVFCLNEEDRDYLHRRLGVVHERTTRMVPGAEPLFAATAANRSYARADRLLFAATWRKNKGIEDLIPAVEELCRQRPALQLTVLGAGVPDDTVITAFHRDVRAQVRCVSAATEVETARAFAEADLFFLPSLFEGTPLTLMEAMMSGLPIATTAVCGMRDVIDDRRNGLLFPIRSPRAIVEAVTTLIESEPLRAALGAAARRDAQERYTWDHATERVWAAYDRLLGHHEVSRAS